MAKEFDVIVIGGGHAGAEAAWAASRMGAQTLMITLDPSKIGAMSCNPAIGGLAKGQMVREIDALGGLMGLATDATGIQFRMLNRSKGPAVWGPRAQCDKHRYAAEVQRLLSTCSNLRILRGEVAEIETAPSVDGGAWVESTAADTPRSAVSGVLLVDGTRLRCRAVVVTTGTFLRALMHTGETRTEGGRVGEAAAKGLSDCLRRLGLQLGRLKTGTPPRLHRDSIDFSRFETQPGDDPPTPFSFLNEYATGLEGPAATFCDRASFSHSSAAVWRPPLPQLICWLGRTNPQVHEIIRANLHRAPMYSGQITSTGPRYCPSIEDKVVRFADKPAHQVFLEPEGLDVPEIYVNGVSTSLPADVQEQLIRLIPGLENARILRYGYAVEYDMVWPTQIRPTLQTKQVQGLFLAGQINGTSGYEEAAGQGLVAGINATLYAAHGPKDPAEFVLGRDQAYIGVLIDDLVTKPPTEPYRMFTSRAEHRLHLRSDNADQRLTPLGRRLGLVDASRWQAFESRQGSIDSAIRWLKSVRVEGMGAYDWLRREGNDWQALLQRALTAGLSPPALSPQTARLVEIIVRYDAYIRRQNEQIERFARLENKLIPPGLDYSAVIGLRNEARQKLATFTPRSLGQALRISGITPADVTLISIHLARRSSASGMGGRD
ncbi:MAG: tRNA uridine-5-carboxymethylaminomethyl(34) synthesis enzyme MnmG [Phycisphaerae bacterium]|nr:tRNA uridine-5-carboxymethylaminomethyl(34) synthesis enzyme MnmG [Phycisphaerae bacterium]MDW8262222.1 tRNA uridine-5-carboxymethylaminomethyl(34) synthesis enzyme MnmG [Phycisphaerales bacterium]